MQTSFPRPLRAILAAFLLFAIAAGPCRADEKGTEKPQEKRVVKDMIMEGDARCTRCHSDVNGDEIENYPILPIARTKHGTRADSRTPTCVGCHGDSEPHLKHKGTLRPPPDRSFGKKAAGNAKAHNQSCLQCHEGGKLMHWGGSTHSRRDVPCSDCHQMHVAQDKATTREKVADMCMSCHKEKRAQFARPNHHPVPEGKMTCPDCHNAHGSAGPKLMARDSVNETCYTCHMEYRGPFLWTHTPVAQDCSICHNPHGTTTTGLLKLRPPFLCQQCHEPTSHRGNYPGLTPASPRVPARSTGNAYDNTNLPDSGGLTQARGCANCHTNIHGGNNATNAGNSRSFRR